VCIYFNYKQSSGIHSSLLQLINWLKYTHVAFRTRDVSFLRGAYTYTNIAAVIYDKVDWDNNFKKVVCTHTNILYNCKARDRRIGTIIIFNGKLIIYLMVWNNFQNVDFASWTSRGSSSSIFFISLCYTGGSTSGRWQ